MGFPKDLTETCMATRTGSLGEFKRPLPQNPRLPPAGKQPEEFTQGLPEEWRPLELCKAQWHSAFQCHLHFLFVWICGQTDRHPERRMLAPLSTGVGWTSPRGPGRVDLVPQTLWEIGEQDEGCVRALPFSLRVMGAYPRSPSPPNLLDLHS